ncbi:hypothetical protein [Pseudoalteromonas sp. SR45-4]|uniref:hypothetical protein n=1 Tax=Pseudoalteromonas sp. SR45-4 TaxID=2760929 RepID=UPI0015FE4F95|nr:hypothetical protein [Pseudoalteromonas sp. SR45-4]MBB1371251.1 hypothetical protein [Pseudoalteromonas sp. SR45-4]
MNIDTTARIKRQETKITKPDFALVFYNTADSDVAITKHDFDADNNLKQGMIINPEKLASIINENKASKSQKAESHISIIPQNLIFEDYDTVVWYQPSVFHPMWFRLSSKKPFMLRVNWPTLLFIAKKNSNHLRVLTLDSNERPTMDSMTYTTPLPNLNSANVLCQGSAPLPKVKDSSTIGLMQETLYESAFENFRHDKALKGKSSVHSGIDFWKEKASKQDRLNPKVELNEFATLGDVLTNRMNEVFFCNK